MWELLQQLLQLPQLWLVNTPVCNHIMAPLTCTPAPHQSIWLQWSSPTAQTTRILLFHLCCKTSQGQKLASSSHGASCLMLAFFVLQHHHHHHHLTCQPASKPTLNSPAMPHSRLTSPPPWSSFILCLFWAHSPSSSHSRHVLHPLSCAQCLLIYKKQMTGQDLWLPALCMIVYMTTWPEKGSVLLDP